MPFETIRRSQVVAFISVVEDHIENDFNTRLVR
jgi:hypothetical protein